MGQPGASPGAASASADIRFRSVSKRFGEVLAVDHVTFEITRGSFHSFLGPSGCGKTTTLRLIAGFEQPDEGAVEIAGQSMVGIPAYRRPVNMVFQHYALFPHMNVAQNVGYGLRQRRPRLERAEMEKRTAEALDLVRLPGMGPRRTWELSGGQQQRVALARALINRPTVLLLDEPLAALDRKLRRDMQIELQNLQRDVGITFILVTHDQEEALSMSDSISIMREGRIAQSGSPEELYDAPASRYVAGFVGESNFFAGQVTSVSPTGAEIEIGAGQRLFAPVNSKAPPLAPGGAGVIVVRPEVVGMWRAGSAPADLALCRKATVRNRIYLGDHSEFSLSAEGLGDVLARMPKSSALATELAPGDLVEIGWRSEQALALCEA